MTEKENQALIFALRKWSLKEPIFQTALDHLDKVAAKVPQNVKQMKRIAKLKSEWRLNRELQCELAGKMGAALGENDTVRAAIIDRWLLLLKERELWLYEKIYLLELMLRP